MIELVPISEKSAYSRHALVCGFFDAMARDRQRRVAGGVLHDRTRADFGEIGLLSVGLLSVG